jgi:hypothetical protein
MRWRIRPFQAHYQEPNRRYAFLGDCIPIWPSQAFLAVCVCIVGGC